MFMANYSQKESDRLGLGLRFIAPAPRMKVFVVSGMGLEAVP
jgi:hypothetical protein